MPDLVDSSTLAKGSAADLRKRSVVICDNFYKYRNQIKYSQSRPTQLRWPRFTTRSDCSGLVSSVFNLLGMLPGTNWAYQNTWSLIRRGRPVIDKAHALPLDLVFYGPRENDPTHVAIVIGHDRVLSNGHYPMSHYQIDYRPDRIAIRRYVGADPSA